ncbi:MAG: hypothetical protein ACLGSD_11540 [Acidobacteriota bacterium]
MAQPISIGDSQHYQMIVARERRKSLMLRAWILSGLFFMALPGTLLGFTNLMAIATHHGLGAMPAAWIQGHGHAQVFGWIGSFILGIGFYSQPAHGRSVLRIPLTCFLLWTPAVLLRWIAGIYAWQWRALFVLSASMELAAVLLFLYAASHHKMPDSGKEKSKPRIELWMISVFVGTAGLLAALIFNFVECIRLAAQGTSLAFPHELDQRYLVLLAWAFITPTVWGFSARWLPAFLAIARPSGRLFKSALVLLAAGVLAGVAGFGKTATILLFLSSIAILFALQLTRKPHGHAKVQGIHPSFPVFVRLTYVWLIIASALGIWAAFADVHGGIWGASRHALTVGFAATMVFAIGPRILPHFGGIERIYSRRLMFLALLILQLGCTLRVSSEPLAYEGIAPFAWHVLPISGVLELTGVLIFAVNLALTMTRGKSAFAAQAVSSAA